MTLNIQKYLRIKDWWSHILPPVLLFFYIGIHPQASNLSHLFFLYSFIILLSVFTAVTGYFLNDLFDIKDDLLAGKPNFVSTQSATFKYLFSIFIIGCILLFYYLSVRFCTGYESRIFQIFFTVNIGLFLIYSVPPVRLKSSPYTALFTDALYSGTVFYIMAFLITDSDHAGNYRILACLFLAGFVKGIRNYLTHISLDEENDKSCGQHSLATIYGKSKILPIANLIFPFELILLSVILYITHYGIIVPVLFLLSIYLIKWIITFKKKPADSISGLNDLYEIWLPVLILVYIFLLNHALYPLLIIHTLLFPNYLDRIYFYTLYKYIGPLRKKENEGRQ